MPPLPGYRQGMEKLKDALLAQADQASEALFRSSLARRMRKEMYGKDWDTSAEFYKEVATPYAIPPPQTPAPLAPEVQAANAAYQAQVQRNQEAVDQQMDRVRQLPGIRHVREFFGLSTPTPTQQVRK